MTWLPPGSEPVSGSAFYFRPEEGENRVRVLAEPIIGWIGWTAAKKPLRRPVNLDTPHLPTIQPEEVVLDENNTIRKFWSLPVYDYKDKRVKVWEIGQSTIQAPIKKLAEDEDWGDPRRYDLKITRTTEKGRTSYTVQPAPKKRADESIVQAWREVVAKGFDLSVLFQGGDPFNPGRSARPNGQDRTGFPDETYFEDEAHSAQAEADSDEIPF